MGIMLQRSININIYDIECLKRWAEYMPECFTKNLAQEQYIARLEEDIFILRNIEKLYDLIKEIDGITANYEDKIYIFKNDMTQKQYTRLKKYMSNIPSFNIRNYFNLKLTEEEKQICYDFMKECNHENSLEMMKKVQENSNFFLGSYITFLLINHPESNYMYSIDNIRKSVDVSTIKLEKRLKKIEQTEREAWDKANQRIYP